jgi:hypothetical protein
MTYFHIQGTYKAASQSGGEWQNTNALAVM